MEIRESAIKLAAHLDVMVADADNFFCLLVEEYLRRIGFRKIYLVTKAELALWKLSRRRFDIILLESCVEYRKIWEKIASERHRHGLLLGMTYDRTGRDWLAALAYAADAILTKPFTRARLASVLSDLLISPASYRCKVVQLPSASTAGDERDDYIPLL